MDKYTLRISGAHCASCKILIENTLCAHAFIRDAKVNLQKSTLDITSGSGASYSEMIVLLNTELEPLGYSVSLEPNMNNKKTSSDVWLALPIGFGIIMLFLILQKLNILNFGIGGQVTPTTSFLIGLIASASSCLAIVGGLVLSLSAKISEDNVSDTKTFTLFHVSRIISFAVCGGLLGALGQTININFAFTTIIGLAASVVMLILGFNLLGVFIPIHIPFASNIFKFFKSIEHKTLTPIAFGFATLFLPCGFTQSMQIAAFSSQSFMSGMLIMLTFALGTLPMLLLLSFGSASLAHGKYASVFLKSAGVVVIGLGLLSLFAGMAGLGIIPPLFNI